MPFTPTIPLHISHAFSNESALKNTQANTIHGNVMGASATSGIIFEGNIRINMPNYIDIFRKSM